MKYLPSHNCVKCSFSSGCWWEELRRARPPQHWGTLTVTLELLGPVQPHLHPGLQCTVWEDRPLSTQLRLATCTEIEPQGRKGHPLGQPWAGVGDRCGARTPSYTCPALRNSDRTRFLWKPYSCYCRTTENLNKNVKIGGVVALWCSMCLAGAQGLILSSHPLPRSQFLKYFICELSNNRLPFLTLNLKTWSYSFFSL